MKRLGQACAIGIAGLLLSYCALFNRIEAYHVGMAWNFVSGELTLQEPGVYVSPPWMLVSSIDTRPQRVCITSASRTAFNCKLVQFDQDSWRELVTVEGWRYYWLSNRLSFNIGYQEEYRGFRDILRGYAFSAKQYPFIRVLKELDS